MSVRSLVPPGKPVLESRRHPEGRPLPHAAGDGAGARVRTHSEPNRILVVEDQADVRMMLVTALRMEGYAVDQAADAHGGLEHLGAGRYHLVLSDYAMPGGTGTWMLEEAARTGRLGDTPALILTAHPGVADLADVEVVAKPLDLDRFLEQVRQVLCVPAEAEDDPPESEAGVRDAHDAERGRQAEHKVELVLYVSSASPASLQAQQNFERVLHTFDRRQVKFSICDLGSNPSAGVADRIAFTPTLVKRFPEPRMWVLGNLREPQILADLLRVYGVDSLDERTHQA